jgi:hypothetical protein
VIMKKWMDNVPYNMDELVMWENMDGQMNG